MVEFPLYQREQFMITLQEICQRAHGSVDTSFDNNNATSSPSVHVVGGSPSKKAKAGKIINITQTTHVLTDANIPAMILITNATTVDDRFFTEEYLGKCAAYHASLPLAAPPAAADDKDDLQSIADEDVNVVEAAAAAVEVDDHAKGDNNGNAAAATAEEEEGTTTPVAVTKAAAPAGKKSSKK